MSAGVVSKGNIQGLSDVMCLAVLSLGALLTWTSKLVADCVPSAVTLRLLSVSPSLQVETRVQTQPFADNKSCRL